MSVESEILRIQHNIANAYAAVSEKGGEVPLQPTSANLAAAVATIPEGSSVPDDMPVIPKTLAEYNALSTEERQSETMFIVSRPTSAEEQEWWSPMMTSDNAPTPFIASSSESGSGHPYEAFDNSLGTYWMSSNTANPWISIFIGGGKTIAGLKMRPFNNNDNNRLAFPKVFTIDGSNDGIQWETVFSADGTEDYDPQLGEYRECLFSRSQQYSYYRISMAENYRPSESDHYLVISDIQLANGTAPFPTKIKYKDETLNAGGGTVNWDDINGRPDLSTVSSMVVAPVVLSSAAWDANKQQTVPIEGILADEDAQLIIPMPKSEAYNTAGVECVSQAEGTLTFQADTVPTVDLSLNVYIFGAAEVKEEYVGEFEWWSPHMTSKVTPVPYAVSTNHDHKSYPDYYAFDGNESTGWATGTISTKAWISFDFGEPTSVDGLRMMPLSVDPVTWMPHTGSIQGSRDGTTWIDIVSFSDLPAPSDRNFREHMFTEALYRYYRIYDMQSYSTQQNYVSIGEIQFHKAVRA